MLCDILFGNISEADTFERGADHKFKIVDDQRTGDGYRKLFAAPLEFPSINFVDAVRVASLNFLTICLTRILTSCPISLAGLDVILNPETRTGLAPDKNWSCAAAVMRIR